MKAGLPIIIAVGISFSACRTLRPSNDPVDAVSAHLHRGETAAAMEQASRNLRRPRSDAAQRTIALLHQEFEHGDINAGAILADRILAEEQTYLALLFLPKLIDKAGYLEKYVVVLAGLEFQYADYFNAIRHAKQVIEQSKVPEHLERANHIVYEIEKVRDRR